MVEEGIYALIAGNAGLVALLPDGDGIAFGPAPVQRGQSVYPCLTYQINKEGSDYALDGSEFENGVLQFNVYSKDGTDANVKIVKALRRLIDKFNGLLSDGTRVLGITHQNTFPSFENDGDAYRSITEYEIQFVEPN